MGKYLEISPKDIIDRHTSCVDRRLCFEARSNCVIEPRPIEEKVYKPKVSYSAGPMHLKPPIHAEKLGEFYKRMKRIPEDVSFDDAYDAYNFHQWLFNQLTNHWTDKATTSRMKTKAF